MKPYKITFLWPVVSVAVGWLWQYVGYRLTFGATHPEYGFYRRPEGPALQTWLFTVPTVLVLSSLLLHTLLACRSLFLDRQRVVAIGYLAICLVLAFAFLFPGVWFIDIPGRGEFLI